MSPFGGIVAVNRTLDRATADAMQDLFLEVVIAPRVAPAALELFAELEEDRAVRLLSLDIDEEVDLFDAAARRGAGRRAAAATSSASSAASSCRTATAPRSTSTQCEVVTKRAPTADELAALDFAWRVCKHVKSNAIVRDARATG